MRIFIAMLLVLSSCKEKPRDLVQYENGRQLLTLNNTTRDGKEFDTPQVTKVSADSIIKGEELLIRIFLEERGDIRLIDAFIGCKQMTNPSVDTMSYKITGCSNGLIVQNDTILVGLRPIQSGVFSLPEITILTKDTKNVYRTLRYTPTYKVVVMQKG